MHVSELAKESGETRYPFESRGLKEAVERIQTDKGSFKGELYFKANFVPAIALKGIKFDTEQGEDKTGGSTDEDVPMEVTIKRQSTSSLRSPKEEGAPETPPSSDEPPESRNAEDGIELSTEKLLAQRLFSLLCPIFAFTRFYIYRIWHCHIQYYIRNAY